MRVSRPSNGGDRVDGQALPPQLSELDSGAKTSVRILVVDDERTLRESCRTFLETEGYNVQVCGKGDEALDLLKRRTFDIVFIDQYMSDVPGAKLLETCLQKNRDTIAIVMTGNPSVEASLEVLRSGAWDYLTKPFSATQLQILIGRATHTAWRARETRQSTIAAAREHGFSAEARLLGVSPAARRARERTTGLWHPCPPRARPRSAPARGTGGRGSAGSSGSDRRDRQRGWC